MQRKIHSDCQSSDLVWTRPTHLLATATHIIPTNVFVSSLSLSLSLEKASFLSFSLVWWEMNVKWPVPLHLWGRQVRKLLVNAHGIMKACQRKQLCIGKCHWFPHFRENVFPSYTRELLIWFEYNIYVLNLFTNFYDF